MLYKFKKGSRVGTTTKNIKYVYSVPVFTLRTIKKWFNQSSGINNDFIRDFVSIYQNISTESFTKKLNVDRISPFKKILNYTLNIDI